MGLLSTLGTIGGTLLGGPALGTAMGGALGSLGGGSNASGSGSGNPVGDLQAAQDKALAQQAEFLRIQQEYQSKKEALDAVAAMRNSEHQGLEKTIGHLESA